MNQHPQLFVSNRNSVLAGRRRDAKFSHRLEKLQMKFSPSKWEVNLRRRHTVDCEAINSINVQMGLRPKSIVA